MDGLTPDTALFTPLLSSRATELSVYETRAAWQEARRQERAAERALFESRYGDGGDALDADLLVLQAQAAAARERAELLAAKTLEQLQALATTHPRAARDLADVLWNLLSESESRGDKERAAHYVALLEEHDDGRYVDLVEGTGTLEVRSDPTGARVRLRRLDDERASARDLGPTPVDPFDIEPGEYLLEIESPGLVGVQRRVRVGRAADVQVLVRLFSSAEVGRESFYLPAGRFRLGGELLEGRMHGSQEVFVDNLAVARRGVTVGEFLLFLDELAEQDAERALRYTPATMRASLPRETPVLGVSHGAATAFARWSSERTGVTHRLPTEAEWEKAASSPAGGEVLQGVCEWTVAIDDGARPLLRGGASIRCRCSEDRRGTLAGVGFRLVRDLTPGGGERVLEMQIPEAPETQVAA